MKFLSRACICIAKGQIANPAQQQRKKRVSNVHFHFPPPRTVIPISKWMHRSHFRIQVQHMFIIPHSVLHVLGSKFLTLLPRPLFHENSHSIRTCFIMFFTETDCSKSSERIGKHSEALSLPSKRV